MKKQNTALIFLLKWTVIFTLLYSLPYVTGWDKQYSRMFYSFCTSSFTGDHVEWKHNYDKNPWKDINIKVRANKPNSDGTRNVAKNEFASARDGLLPTVMIIALILATPMALMQKLWMLFAGFIVIHIYIYLRMMLRISQWVGAATTGKMDNLYFWLFENNMGYRYLIPILLWILLLFAFNFKSLKAINFSLKRLVDEGFVDVAEKRTTKKKVRRK